MKGNYNLASGFLFLYDWLPMLDALTGEEFKALFKAVVERQRNETPIPPLESGLATLFASIIEPTVKRRLEGQKASKRASKEAESEGSSEEPSGVPSPPSKAKQRKAKQRKEKKRKEKHSISASPSAKKGEGRTIPLSRRASSREAPRVRGQDHRSRR